MLTRRRRSKHSAPRYPVLSDKPVWIHNPKRKVRVLAVMFGLAIAVSSVAGAVVATTLASEQNSDSKQQLLDDIRARAKQRDQEASRFQAALNQYRVDQCEITARLPQDPPIVDIRHRYHCDNPVATPPPAPAATPSAAGAGTGRAGSADRSPAPRSSGPPRVATPGQPPGPRPQPPPAPAPVPQPPVSPIPPVPTPDPDLCLPILGICLF